MDKTHIGLIRHAPTDWNSIKRIQGQTDVGLSPEAYELIDQWKTSLNKHPWSRILTSDLSRAYLTAFALNRHLNLPLKLDKRLREQDWGHWTGKSIHKLRKTDPEAITKEEAAGWDFTPPGGESRKEVLLRTLEAIHEASRRWRGEAILVVTHYGNIASLANHLMHRKFLPEEGKLIKKHALHRILIDHSYPEATKYSLVALNEDL